MGNPIGASISAFVTTPDSALVNDRGSGSRNDLSLWTPDPSALIADGVQYYYLGLFGTNNYACPPNPSGPFFCFQMNDEQGNQILEAPTGFTTVWECNSNDNPSTLGIYNLIAPLGYVGIGSIAVMDFNDPPGIGGYPHLMCIREDLATPVILTENDLIWTDQGSGAPGKVNVWRLPYSGAAFAYRSPTNVPYPESVSAFDINYMFPQV